MAKRATDQRASATTEEEMQGIPEEVLLMWKQHLHKTNPAEADASNYVVDVYVEQEPEDIEREMANYRTYACEVVSLRLCFDLGASVPAPRLSSIVSL